MIHAEGQGHFHPGRSGLPPRSGLAAQTVESDTLGLLCRGLVISLSFPIAAFGQVAFPLPAQKLLRQQLKRGEI
jgi:hypothetical protein